MAAWATLVTTKMKWRARIWNIFTVKRLRMDLGNEKWEMNEKCQLMKRESWDCPKVSVYVIGWMMMLFYWGERHWKKSRYFPPVHRQWIMKSVLIMLYVKYIWGIQIEALNRQLYTWVESWREARAEGHWHVNFT